AKGDGLLMIDLLNEFTRAKERQRDAGELAPRSLHDYKEICKLLDTALGRFRRVDEITAADFGALRARMAAKWGPVRLGNAITRVKSVFAFGYESGLMDRPVRFGPEFKKPGKAVLRKHCAKAGPKMLEADELRKVIDEAGVPLKAMVLLALNAGL